MDDGGEGGQMRLLHKLKLGLLFQQCVYGAEVPTHFLIL